MCAVCGQQSPRVLVWECWLNYVINKSTTQTANVDRMFSRVAAPQVNTERMLASPDELPPHHAGAG